MEIDKPPCKGILPVISKTYNNHEIVVLKARGAAGLQPGLAQNERPTPPITKELGSSKGLVSIRSTMVTSRTVKSLKSLWGGLVYGDRQDKQSRDET